MSSLSQLTGVSEERIISVLKHDWVKIYEKAWNDNFYSEFSEEIITDDFGEYILKKGFPEICCEIERPSIHWFHGTRAINPNDFINNGILPLHEMYPKIKKTVDDIASKLDLKTKNGSLQRHNKWLTELKLSDSKIHGGPFAMLMYDAVYNPNRFGNHSYIDEPEIISNYAYMMYDDNADLIINEYKRISMPLIVEFVEPKGDKLISLKLLITTAIQYLYQIVHKGKIGLNCNICFSNNGNPIPPESIVKVYKV